MEGLQMQDYDEEYYDEYSEDPESFSNKLNAEQIKGLIEYCIEPTVTYGYSNIIILLACCLIYRVVSNAIKTPDTSHILSTAIGIYVLYIYFKLDTIHVIGLVVAGYIIILVLSNFNKSRGYLTSALFIVYLVVCEKWLVQRSVWIKIRGPQMIASMKIISVAFDLDRHTVSRVGILEYFGYVLCPGSCVWGPWIPFTDYKSKQETVDDNKWFIYRGIYKCFISLFYFVVSTCLLEYIITPSWDLKLIIYRDALIFRTSHYFVSYVSEATTSLAGYDIVVTNPSHIELPASLSQVVKHWNLPIHQFLKNYVFKTTIKFGSFVAIMLTYLVSSLLHGLNIKLAAVLLSLGLYTYIEHSLRLNMSIYYNACLCAKPCTKWCTKHIYTSRSHLLVKITNIFFGFIDMCHLAYLGILMDPTDGSTEEYPLQRWHDLYYVSHFFALMAFISNLCFIVIIRLTKILDLIEKERDEFYEQLEEWKKEQERNEQGDMNIRDQSEESDG